MIAKTRNWQSPSTVHSGTTVFLLRSAYDRSEAESPPPGLVRPLSGGRRIFDTHSFAQDLRVWFKLWASIRAGLVWYLASPAGSHGSIALSEPWTNIVQQVTSLGLCPTFCSLNFHYKKTLCQILPGGRQRQIYLDLHMLYDWYCVDCIYKNNKIFIRWSFERL